jgi:hypothetical protein
MLAGTILPPRRANLPESKMPASSPYSTGGGGVILEHEYAASALASLLLAQPIEGLGDDFTLLDFDTHIWPLLIV